VSRGDYDHTLNLMKHSTSSRLFLVILFSFLSVAGSGSVVYGDFLVAPNSAVGNSAHNAADYARLRTHLAFQERLTRGGKFVAPGGEALQLGQSRVAVFDSLTDKKDMHYFNETVFRVCRKTLADARREA
jgi:hypothetical protein